MILTKMAAIAVYSLLLGHQQKVVLWQDKEITIMGVTRECKGIHYNTMRIAMSEEDAKKFDTTYNAKGSTKEMKRMICEYFATGEFGWGAILLQ